jgi:hypothetical protein
MEGICPLKPLKTACSEYPRLTMSQYRPGCRLRSWVLANRTYHILGDLAATNVAQLELKVARGPSGWRVDGQLGVGQICQVKGWQMGYNML